MRGYAAAMATGAITAPSIPVPAPGSVRRHPLRPLRSGVLLIAVALVAGLVAPVFRSDVAAISQTLPYPTIDARSSMNVRLDPTPAQIDALEAMPGATVRWDTQHGVPAVVMRYGAALTGPNTTAMDFLREHATLFNLSPTDLENLQPLKEYRTAHNGALHVQLQQVDQGRVVYGSLIKLTLDREGRVVIAGGAFFPGARVDEVPKLTAQEAVWAAGHSIDIQTDNALTIITQEPGPSGTTVFANSLASRIGQPQPIRTELVTYPMPADQPARLGWKVSLETDSGWYEMVIDAQTSDVLHRSTFEAHAPEANVFTVQNPNLGSQQIVPLTGASFNNAGWVTDRTTSGNNAHAYEDRDNDDIADYQPQTPPFGDPEYQRFIYNFTDAYVTSGGTDVTTDRDAAIAQAFYRVNWLHDYFYELGFDEAAGNFQDDNFGRGGSGGDGMLVEVHNSFSLAPDLREGSNTQTPADGARPRMELNVGFVDGAMDADLVTHEYTHGVGDRLLAGQGLPEDEQTWALGEGWSDFYGTSIWDDPVAGDYVCSNSTTGCPLYAYDNTPLVYSDLCTLADTPNRCEPHRDGEIWTAPLWDLRTAFVDDYGAAVGKNRTEQLVIDGIKNTTPPKANFLDARDGILAADFINNGGAHQCLIWRVFAGREMGLSASTSADQETVVPATDVPAVCEPSADAGGPYTTTEGTDVTLNGGLSSAGTDPSIGALLYEWDLDSDGEYDDATGPNPVFALVGQDGAFTVGLRVTNGAGLSDTDTATGAVSNVAPAVALDPIASSVEGGTVVLSGDASDPGWLDPLTAAVDWGDGAGPQPLAGAVENARPNATLSFDTTHTYGDDGTFVVAVCVSDDDTTTCTTANAVVDNVDPLVAIAPLGQTVYDGVSVYIHHAGDPATVEVAFADPGSDDLTMRWDWDDGTASIITSFVNPPNPDPLLSPSVQPRGFVESASHTYGDACVYTADVSAADDDGGYGSDQAIVVILGNGTRLRGSGWWMNQYRPKNPNSFTSATLTCYLDVAVLLSTVFNTLLTRADAVDILFVNQNKGSAEELFDRKLLTAWLNFANGSIALDQPVDTDGDDLEDSTFGAALLAAENVRNDPNATRAQLLEQKDVLERILG